MFVFFQSCETKVGKETIVGHIVEYARSDNDSSLTLAVGRLHYGGLYYRHHSFKRFTATNSLNRFLEVVIGEDGFRQSDRMFKRS